VFDLAPIGSLVWISPGARPSFPLSNSCISA
jgi:hypothetical protein